MSLSRRATERPIAVAMFFLAVILLGFVSLRRLPIDLLPDVSYPQLVIYTTDDGVSPSEMERSITEQVERAVASVAGVQRVESVSREGVSLVTVRFAWGADMDFAALNVRERIDNIRASLPIRASQPVVLRTDPRSEPILSVSVAGPSDLRALKELAEQVFKRRLEQLDGVAHAAVTGGFEREIQVDVDPRRLESYGLTIEQIAQALSNANAAGQGGTIRQGRYRYALRTLGEFRAPDEIGAVVLTL
ncbi:MAG TPA: efflux RND transporter permease subunit, partial [Longimicrobiaceae bacterium]|nr:efflux RND transporter permease subunit [Longimicrobiaceae bacterium]